MSSPDTSLSYSQPWSRKLHGYLTLARISNAPTVVSNALAGAALAGALQPSATLALVALALVLFYTAGMYLNDLCDYAIDRRERPGRPLPSGLISRPAAAVATVVFFGIGSALLAAIGPAPFISGVALIGLIVVYDAWHKANPISPLIMAGCRLLAYATAYLAFSTELTGLFVIAGCLLVGYLVGLTYLAKNENKPTFSKYWPIAILFLPAAFFLFQGQPLLLMPLVGLFAAWVAYSVSFVYRKSGRNIGAAIGRLIAGISLFDSLVLGAAGAVFGVALALFAFGTTRFFQRYIKGT
jgi:4-hydroxybenzoate polyprenyltransferase